MIARSTAALHLFLLLILSIAACSNDGGSGHKTESIPATETPALGQQHPLMQTLNGDFFDFPWPNDIRRHEDGTLNLKNYPGSKNNFAVSYAILAGQSLASGFSTNGAIYFSLSDALDISSIPDTKESQGKNSTIILVNLEKNSSRYLERIPVLVDFKEAATTNRPGKLLSILPLPGVSLEPNARYAALLMDGLIDTENKRFAPAPLLALLKGEWQEDSNLSRQHFSQLKAQYDLVFDYLDQQTEQSAEQLLAFTVFTTRKQNHDLENIVSLFDSMPDSEFIARVTDLDFILDCNSAREDFDDLAHIRGIIEVPRFQHGAYPYTISGGNLRYDNLGMPLIARWESLSFSMAIPCHPPIASKFALTIYGEGFGGTHKHYLSLYFPLLNFAAPAYAFNHIGVAITPSMSAERISSYIPGVISSLELLNPSIRNTLASYTEATDTTLKDITAAALIYNPLNPIAATGNQLQAASEFIFLRRVFIHLPKIIENLNVDLPAGIDERSIRVNPAKTGLVTQSRSSVPAPLALAAEKAFNFAVINAGSALDSAQATYRPDLVVIWETMLTDFSRNELDIFHPLPQLVQTFFEPTTPINHASRITTPNLLITAGCKDIHVARQSTEPMGIALALNNGLQLADLGTEVSGSRTLGITQLPPPIAGNNTERGFSLFLLLKGGHFDAYQRPWVGQFLYDIGADRQPILLPFHEPGVECQPRLW